MRIPRLTSRESEHLNEIFMELGLEIKGLNDLTKQNLSKDVKPLDTKD